MMSVWIVPAMLAFIVGGSTMVCTLASFHKEKKQEARARLVWMQNNVAAGFRARSTSNRAPHSFLAH